MNTNRHGWIHAVTLLALTSLSIAGAMLSARSQFSAPEARPIGAFRPAQAPSDPRTTLFPGLVEALSRVEPRYAGMIERRLELAASMKPAPKFSACFAPGTPNEVMEAFRLAEARLFADRFQNNNRWGATAYTPTPGANGTPVVISYSIVPDGTPIAGFNGEAAATSNLRAYLNGIYGSQAVWLPIIQNIFNRWHQYCGITYVFEANDDGAALAGSSTAVGIPGVRGDVRISGHFIDGNSGILAYNFYPDPFDAIGGEMVIDTGDNFFATTTNSSQRLRNVMYHEHGHGIGMPHTCPIETTKLMEPFVATNFDGPRHDDVRSAQFFYGDPNEPNNFAAQATGLGTLDCGTITVGTMPAPLAPVAPVLAEMPVASNVSISNTADDDFYAVTVTQATNISITMTPIGFVYDDSAQACSGQNGSCCSGAPTDSAAVLDLAVNLLSTDGTTPLASAAGAPLGQPEIIPSGFLPGPGTYFIQVKPAGPWYNSQEYTLTISSTPATLSAGLTGDQDIAIPAGRLIPVPMKINDGTEEFDLANSTFYYNHSIGAPFVTAPIYDQGGGAYVAALADITCTDTPEFYAELRTKSGSLVRLPCSGTYKPRTGAVSNIYSTNFESSTGWVVGPNTAPTGLWENAVPVGTAAQPAVDHSTDNAKCFITGQGAVGGASGANDVDGGNTILTSPAMNVAGMQDAEISYWRWFANGAGSGTYNDTFVVQASNNNGTSFVNVETVGPGSATDPNVNPGWRLKSFKLSSIGLATSAAVKVRFTAQDTGTASLVEAAIDDFKAVAYSCSPIVWCSGDLNLDALVEDSDFVIFAHSYEIFDCAAPNMPAGCPSDINDDGQVDDADFVIFATAYNELICP